eukprot:9247332-Pyramimonas_sp.AAC.1
MAMRGMATQQAHCSAMMNRRNPWLNHRTTDRNLVIVTANAVTCASSERESEIQRGRGGSI